MPSDIHVKYDGMWKWDHPKQTRLINIIEAELEYTVMDTTELESSSKLSLEKGARNLAQQKELVRRLLRARD